MTSAIKLVNRNISPNTIANAVINGKSIFSAALTAILPSPGQAKTVSVTTVPVKKPANRTIVNVRGAMRELRNACFHITVVLDTPFALASFTNSLSRTSSVDERTSLSKAEAGIQPRVITGNT